MEVRYEGREHSAAKHKILQQYLESLAYKVALSRAHDPARTGALTINYVDAFAGPWSSQSSDLSDTSPSIAVHTLLRAKASLAGGPARINVRAFFVSQTREGVEQLEDLARRFPGAEFHIAMGTFEESLPAAEQFVGVGENRFTFLFIDPTGWTGFGMKEITPLLRKDRNEVLINFMLKDIRRFANQVGATHSESINTLYGDEDCRREWADLTGVERDDKLVEVYCSRVALAGGYKHCVSAPIFSPTKDREYFRLVYGTRSDIGLVTFREAERKGLAFQTAQRAGAKQRMRVKKSLTPELFSAMDMISTKTHEQLVHDRHRVRALGEIDKSVRDKGELEWDALVLAALQFPMVSEQDVKAWLKDRERAGVVEVVGLSPRQRVPQLRAGHLIRLR